MEVCKASARLTQPLWRCGADDATLDGRTARARDAARASWYDASVITFDPPLVEGRLVRRYKRFLADVQIGRDTVVAHCPNPGSMRTCADEGGRVWLLRKPATKLGWSWELAEIGGRGGALVSVNTARGNQLVAGALATGTPTQPFTGTSRSTSRMPLRTTCAEGLSSKSPVTHEAATR